MKTFKFVKHAYLTLNSNNDKPNIPYEFVKNSRNYIKSVKHKLSSQKVVLINVSIRKL